MLYNTLFDYNYKKRLTALEAITNSPNPNLEAVKKRKTSFSCKPSN